MNDTSVIIPESAKSLETSPMRRMFSSRPSGEKSTLELRPWRMLSPSSTCAILPFWNSACSSVYATVDLPEPDRPVNHSTQPFWFIAFSRVAVSTEPSCHLMLVESPTLYASTSTFEGADMFRTRDCAKEAAGAARRGVAAWARDAKRASSRRERIVGKDVRGWRRRDEASAAVWRRGERRSDFAPKPPAALLHRFLIE